MKYFSGQVIYCGFFLQNLENNPWGTVTYAAAIHEMPLYDRQSQQDYLDQFI
jgi:hypothetical protein